MTHQILCSDCGQPESECKCHVYCKYSQVKTLCVGLDCHDCLRKQFAPIPTCDHLSDMGAGEWLCDLIEGSENRVCYLARGLECGVNK